jgi:hypothetical protein
MLFGPFILRETNGKSIRRINQFGYNQVPPGGRPDCFLVKLYKKWLVGFGLEINKILFLGSGR